MLSGFDDLFLLYKPNFKVNKKIHNPKSDPSLDPLIKIMFIVTGRVNKIYKEPLEIFQINNLSNNKSVE